MNFSGKCKAESHLVKLKCGEKSVFHVDRGPFARAIIFLCHYFYLGAISFVILLFFTDFVH